MKSTISDRKKQGNNMIYPYPVCRQFTVTGFFSAFRFAWDSSFVFVGESHEACEMVLVTEGAVESTEEGNVYRLEADEMILHAPLEFHRIRGVEGCGSRGMIFSFFYEGELPLMLKRGVFRLTPQQREEYTAIGDGIRSVISRQITDRYEVQAIADRLSAFLVSISRQSIRKTQIASPSAEAYRLLVEDMNAMRDANLSLAEFALRGNISLSYLKLLFSQYAGISPKVYYNNLRFRHVCTLLSQGLTVNEIADRMNFSSANYLTVFFTKMAGISPSEYRKRL